MHYLKKNLFKKKNSVGVKKKINEYLIKKKTQVKVLLFNYTQISTVTV